MPPGPLGFPQAKLTYVDRPEISETFADSCGRVTMEGPNCKLEFVVNRFDDPAPPTPPTGKAVTASRLVVPLPGLLDLHAKLSQLIGQLQAQGTIKAIQMGATPAQGKPN
jgi:hypothetical protein